MKETKRVFVSRMVKSIIILAASIVIGYIMLMLAFLIPISKEKRAINISTHEAEPFFPKGSLITGEEYLHKVSDPDILDYSTDTFIIERSLQIPNEPVFKFSIDYYPRYWGGYVTFFRPLFYFLDLSEIRILNFGLQIVLSFIFSYVLFRVTKKKRYSLAWISLYIILLPNTLAFNFQYSSAYYLAVLSATVLAFFFEYFKKDRRFYYVFFISGILTAYFDFLTYPMLICGLTVATLILLADKKDFFRLLLDVSISLFAWFGGYGLFWASKWVLSTMLTDENIILNAINQIGHYSGVEKMNLFDRVESLYDNWERLAFFPIVLVILSWTIAWVYSYIRNGMSIDTKTILLSLTMGIVPIWHLVIAPEHTIEHSFFTWRNIGYVLFAYFFIVCLSIPEKKDVFGTWKCRFRRIIVICICISLSVVSYYVVPAEKLYVHNYNNDENEIQIPANNKNAFSFSFVPAHNIITRIEPLLKCTDVDGYYTIALIDKDNKELYLTKVESTDADGSIIPTKVFWRVKKGEEYRVNISTENISQPVTTWYTNACLMSELSANNVYPVFGIEYRTKFQRKSITITYILSWFILYLMIANLIKPLIIKREIKK